MTRLIYKDYFRSMGTPHWPARPSTLARRAVLVAAALVAGRAEAGPLAVLPLGDDPATRSLLSAVRQRLQEQGQQLRDAAQSSEAWPAPPRDFAGDCETRFKAGLKLYDDLEFGRARPTLKEALDLCRQAMLHGDAGKSYLRILHYLAAACFYDDDRTGARRYYLDAIAFASGRAPDKRIFSPDVLGVFKKTRVVSTKHPGQLKVVTRPVSARLELDGVGAGSAPVEWSSLAPGQHLLVIRPSGQPPQARWVVVPQGKTVTLSLELTAGGGTAGGGGTGRVDLLRRAAGELEADEPGRAIEALIRELGVGGLVLVSAGNGRAQIGWAEKGAWVKRYKGRLADGGERAFVDRFLSPSAVAVTTPEVSDCGGPSPRPGCRRPPPGHTPIYKRWWFWTLIVAAAGGAGVGIYFGVKSRHPSWTAEVVPGGAN